MRRIITFVTILGFILMADLGLGATKGGLMVSGKVSAIEDGILSLKEPNGQVFKVAVTDDKLKGIKVGERVIVKDVNGWATSIRVVGKKTAKGRSSLTHKKG